LIAAVIVVPPVITPDVTNSPPYFETIFTDLILFAGESSLYVFPDYEDSDNGDILTPSL